MKPSGGRHDTQGIAREQPGHSKLHGRKTIPDQVLTRFDVFPYCPARLLVSDVGIMGLSHSPSGVITHATISSR